LERNPSLVEKLIAHPNFAMRVKEWRDLGMVDETLTADASLHPHYHFLPIDTRYFKDLGLEILWRVGNVTLGAPREDQGIRPGIQAQALRQPSPGSLRRTGPGAASPV